MRGVVLLGVAILVFSVPAVATAATIAGTYRTVVVGEPSGRQVLKVELRVNGQLRYFMAGRIVGWGQWDVSIGILRFTDFGGSAACHGKETIGRYRYVVTPRSLKLTPVNDPCRGRRIRLSTRPLTRV